MMRNNHSEDCSSRTQVLQQAVCLVEDTSVSWFGHAGISMILEMAKMNVIQFILKYAIAYVKEEIVSVMNYSRSFYGHV